MRGIGFPKKTSESNMREYPSKWSFFVGFFQRPSHSRPARGAPVRNIRGLLKVGICFEKEVPFAFGGGVPKTLVAPPRNCQT
jgi:hypothetical protein